LQPQFFEMAIRGRVVDPDHFHGVGERLGAVAFTRQPDLALAACCAPLRELVPVQRVGRADEAWAPVH